MNNKAQQVRNIRFVLTVFIAGLVLSGITAFPLMTEVNALAAMLPDAHQAAPSAFTGWILKIQSALNATTADFPFLAYGTDWLAFGHLAIAIAFIGPWRDPVRNIWVIHFGIIVCVAVIPLAMIAGHIRGIPMWWRLIDCSFGIFGSIPLLVVQRMVSDLASHKETSGCSVNKKGNA